MHPWVPVLVTISLGALGLGVQGLLLAFFLGRMKAHQEGQTVLVQTFQRFTEQAIVALTDRMAKVDSFTAESHASSATFAARLAAIEQATDGLPRFREEFAAFSATTKAHHERVEHDLGRLGSACDSLQRQVAQLAINGPGKLVEMASQK